MTFNNLGGGRIGVAFKNIRIRSFERPKFSAATLSLERKTTNMFHNVKKISANMIISECDSQRVLRRMLCEASEAAYRYLLVSECEEDQAHWQSEKFRFDDALDALDAEFSSLDYPDMDARRTLRGTFAKAQRLIKETDRERYIVYHMAQRWFIEH